MNQTLLVTEKFRVERREFEVADRGLVRRDVVVHPGAVVILPLLTSSKVVTIYNQRLTVGEELLELPAGTLDANESPQHCAARELEEETGYVAERLEPLCHFYTSPGFCTELIHAFVATELRRTAQRLDSSEQIRVHLMDLPDALAATTDGRIRDAKTIAALQVYHYRFRGFHELA